MSYKKLGEDVYLPKQQGKPLQNIRDIKFNYYLSSRIDGAKIYLDITSKIFGSGNTYIRKSCYRVNLGEMEDCVKRNIKEHMLHLGIPPNFIPKSLKNVKKIKNQNLYSEKSF
ncbi:hypothetical protein ML462_00645 [Gramella lutea]|uniref:Uncharacterized protein n=1 Tax=Christiangramia lutea TaxID=1607951 RepID=A0A9X2AA38_9FLAO|nr:hypothetical protein [Christiangramia lutea]MCH4821668.1 hypothetical protein [Christiangramia lutea]